MNGPGTRKQFIRSLRRRHNNSEWTNLRILLLHLMFTETRSPRSSVGDSVYISKRHPGRRLGSI